MTIALLAGWLYAAGCGPACASGLLGNFESEVGPDLDPCTVGRSGIGWPQFSGPRRRRIISTLGSEWCNPRRQLEFIVTELRELGLLDRLLRETDPGRAAYLVAAEYERPRSKSYHRRITRAREIYGQLIAAGAVP